MTNTSHPIDWWLDRLEDVKPVGTGWLARCPAHDDSSPSLSLTVDETDIVLVHCFAGCLFSDILQNLEDPLRIVMTPISAPTTRVPSEQWWEGYTGVPIEFWKSLGVIFSDVGVEFTWARTSVRKIRFSGSKQFSWTPPDSASPPLWPSIPEEPPKTIFLAEGESDTGVLRYAGLPAFGVTKGSKTRLEAILPELRRRGVSRIVSLFDLDAAGDEGLERLAQSCLDANLEYVHGDLSRAIDPTLGETDVRDAWLRSRDPNLFRSIPTDSLVQDHRRYPSLDTFLETHVAEASWCVEKLLLRETVGLVVGTPKVGKTWLVVDLAISVASGTSFLGHFPVLISGPVVLITKEDPDYLLQDRLRKVLISRGLGGTISSSPGKATIDLPGSGIPLFLDLNRDFLFDSRGSAHLLSFLSSVREKYGSLPLVIFDPTLRMISNVDEFKASEIASSVFRIAEIIRSKFQSSVILVHHKSKGATESIKQSYGSIAFHAFSEGTWYLGSRGADDWVDVHVEFKSAREVEWRYRFTDLESDYRVEVSDDVPVKMTSSKGDTDLPKKIETLLKAFAPSGLSVQEIADGIPGASEFMVRNALKVMESRDRIERRKDEISAGGPGVRKDKWYLPT